MDTRRISLADQYADLKRLRREVRLLEENAASASRATQVRATNERQYLKLASRTSASYPP